MAKIVIKRTPEQKAAAKKRFRALLSEQVERSMYLEGQAVPQAMKTHRVRQMRANDSTIK